MPSSILTHAGTPQATFTRADLLKARKLAPNYPWVYYNLACLDALDRKADAAFKNLELALMHGFHNVGLMQRDPDIRTLHRDNRWKALVRKAG